MDLHWTCPKPLHEPVLRSILGGLFAEAILPPGVIIDAGANSGEDACYYAERNPQRTVYAVEPTPSNVAYIKRKFARRLNNLQAVHGGLGSVTQLVYDKRATNSTTNKGVSHQVADVAQSVRVDEAQAGHPGVFRVHRIDDLFASQWHGERLGFAHFDVEGGELDVLLGARHIISRDRPVFTVETFVHNHPNITLRLLHTLDDLGYDSYMVEEQCGLPVDCRNIINIPRELHSKFQQSPTLDLATVTGKLFFVSERTIATQAYASVCSSGNKCCVNGPVNHFGPSWWKTKCCNADCVNRWLDSRHGGRIHLSWYDKPRWFGSRPKHSL